MTSQMLRAVLFLPGTVLVYVPAALIWISGGTTWAARFPPVAWQWLAGLALALPALVLMVWTMRLFARQKHGTPAPWNPIDTLIVEGPYAHVRNPMLIGVCLLLLAEAIVFRSPPVLIWFVLFAVGNDIYFAKSEEPALIERYGAPYVAYRREIPRWIPRRTPYRPLKDAAACEPPGT